MNTLRSSAAAKILNVSSETLRTWEQSGKLPFEVERTEGGQRLYPEAHVHELARRLAGKDPSAMLEAMRGMVLVPEKESLGPGITRYRDSSGESVTEIRCSRPAVDTKVIAHYPDHLPHDIADYMQHIHETLEQMKLTVPERLMPSALIASVAHDAQTQEPCIRLVGDSRLAVELVIFDQDKPAQRIHHAVSLGLDPPRGQELTPWIGAPIAVGMTTAQHIINDIARCLYVIEAVPDPRWPGDRSLRLRSQRVLYRHELNMDQCRICHV